MLRLLCWFKEVKKDGMGRMHFLYQRRTTGEPSKSHLGAPLRGFPTTGTVLQDCGQGPSTTKSVVTAPSQSNIVAEPEVSDGLQVRGGLRSNVLDA